MNLGELTGGTRTTPQTGLKPARLTAVIANRQRLGTEHVKFSGILASWLLWNLWGWNEYFVLARLDRRDWRSVALLCWRYVPLGRYVLGRYFSIRNIISGGHCGYGFWVFLLPRSTNTTIWNQITLLSGRAKIT